MPLKVSLRGDSLLEKLRSGYEEIGMQYPKFHKMDPLSKLAVLTAETLLKNHPIQSDPERIGVLIFNRHSSIDADIQHQVLIDDETDGLASPAIFVYTLPNVMIGEICIRHGFKGENVCFVTAEFDSEIALKQAQLMFSSGMETVLLGFVDTFADSGRAWMVLLQTDGGTPNISQLSATFLSELDNSSKWTNSLKS